MGFVRPTWTSAARDAIDACSRLLAPRMSVAFSPSAGSAINEGDRSADLEDCYAMRYRRGALRREFGGTGSTP